MHEFVWPLRADAAARDKSRSHEVLGSPTNAYASYPNGTHAAYSAAPGRWHDEFVVNCLCAGFMGTPTDICLLCGPLVFGCVFPAIFAVRAYYWIQSQDWHGWDLALDLLMSIACIGLASYFALGGSLAEKSLSGCILDSRTFWRENINEHCACLLPCAAHGDSPTICMLQGKCVSFESICYVTLSSPMQVLVVAIEACNG